MECSGLSIVVAGCKNDMGRVESGEISLRHTERWW